MSWPTSSDYVEAVQNPSYAFDDPDLKRARPEETKLGLPKVISGQFACVFKFATNGQAWAVRCFVREFDDSRERYIEITNALKKENFPFTVQFEYIQQGIRVKGVWFPIIKMQWLSGQLLGNFIADNKSSPATLIDVANQVAEIHKKLRRSRIAHGDLQHGNIIVNQGKLFLIDYDGMYVPGLSGKGSHEIGHRNYQHPFRKEGDFNDSVDIFSVWIIYLSLVALSQDQSLWVKLQGGDDSILLKAQDFKEPYSSATFRILKSHNNEIIQKLAFLIEGLCYSELDALPSFNPDEIASTDNLVKNQTVAGSGEWIKQWITDSPADTVEAGIGWLAGHISVDKPSFNQDQKINALPFIWSLTGSFLVYLFPFLIGLSQLLPAILVQLIIVAPTLFILVRKYRRDEVVKEKIQLILVRDSVVSEIERKRKAITAKKIYIDSAIFEQKKVEASAARDLSMIDAKLQAALKKLAADFNRDRQLFHSKKNEITSAEDNEKLVIQTRFTGTINGLKNEINLTVVRVNNELASELKKHQDTYLRSYLSRYRLSDANLFGIGETLTFRLNRAGIYTAADAGFNRVLAVDGIGEQKGGTIKRWRDDLINRAQSNSPKRLDSHIESQIRAKFSVAVEGKEEQIKSLEQQRDIKIQAIVLSYKVQRESIETNLRRIDIENAKKCSDVRIAADKERSDFRTQAISATKSINDRLGKGQNERRKIEHEIGQLNYQLNVSEKKLGAYKDIRFSNWLKHQVFS